MHPSDSASSPLARFLQPVLFLVAAATLNLGSACAPPEFEGSGRHDVGNDEPSETDTDTDTGSDSGSDTDTDEGSDSGDTKPQGERLHLRGQLTSDVGADERFNLPLGWCPSSVTLCEQKGTEGYVVLPSCDETADWISGCAVLEGQCEPIIEQRTRVCASE